MRRLMSFVSIMFFVTALSASELVYRFPTCQWVNNSLLVRSSASESKFVDLHNKTTTKIKASVAFKDDEQSLKKLFNSGSSLSFNRSVFCVDNGFYSIDYTDEKHENYSRVANLNMMENGIWKTVAKYCMNGKSRPYIFPLRNGNWLVLDAFPDRNNTGKRIDSVFSIMKLNKNCFLENDSKNKIDSGLGKLLENDNVLRAINVANPVVITNSHIVITSYEYGLMWSFSIEDGKSSGICRLYTEVTDEMINKSEVLRTIINMQPLKDGCIFIAARPLAAVVEGGKQLKRINELGNAIATGVNASNAADRYKAYVNVYQEIYSTFPEVYWYKFTPNNGRIERVNPSPVGARDFISSGREFEQFSWLPDENDGIHYLDIDSFAEKTNSVDKKNSNQVTLNQK